MRFKSTHRWLLGGVSVVATLFIFKGAVAQYGPSGAAGMANGANAVAVANEVNQHIHSIALTSTDVATLIGSLP